MSKAILLDTHTWIWLINGQPKFSSKILKLINQAASANAIFVSAISVWELSMLESKERIILTQPVNDWIKDALNAPGIQLIPLLPEISVESCRLPGNFHGDPADRIIVATARIKKLSIITKDKKILTYSKNHWVSAISP